VYQVAKLTGWGHHAILFEVPFTAGLQLLHADATAQGAPKAWKRNNTAAAFDLASDIEAVFAKL
jgi:hypothetical protein